MHVGVMSWFIRHVAGSAISMNGVMESGYDDIFALHFGKCQKVKAKTTLG